MDQGLEHPLDRRDQHEHAGERTEADGRAGRRRVAVVQEEHPCDRADGHEAEGDEPAVCQRVDRAGRAARRRRVLRASASGSGRHTGSYNIARPCLLNPGGCAARELII